MPGGKGPASPSDGDGFLGGNIGLIALFAGVVLVFGGIVAANQAGLFSGGGGGGDILSCEETFTGAQEHEHARLEVYLDSEEPYDFSQQRYQVADPRLHFEGGDGSTVHVHEIRPTLGCLFETLGWEVSPDRIETDTGAEYVANGEGDFEILVNGEPGERGFNQPIEQGDTYVVRYTSSPEDPGDGGNQSDDGNQTE